MSPCLEGCEHPRYLRNIYITCSKLNLLRSHKHVVNIRCVLVLNLQYTITIKLDHNIFLEKLKIEVNLQIWEKKKQDIF